MKYLTHALVSLYGVRQVSTEPVLYFKAYPKVDYCPEAGARVTFDDVKANIGDAFDPSTGCFTAPVSGFYIFSVQLGTIGANNTDFVLVNHNVQESATTSNGGWGSTRMTVISHVTEGHQVYVHKATSHAPKTVRGGVFSHFSGFLLRADH